MVDSAHIRYPIAEMDRKESRVMDHILATNREPRDFRFGRRVHLWQLLQAATLDLSVEV